MQSSSQIISTSNPTSSFFTGQIPFLSPNQQCKVFLWSLATGRGSFIKMASVVPDGFEVAVDSKFSSRRVTHDRKHIN